MSNVDSSFIFSLRPLFLYKKFRGDNYPDTGGYIVSIVPIFLHKVIISGATIGVLFLCMEWVIREKLWRLPIFHRRIDYEETWKCITFYKFVETEDRKFKENFKSYNAIHEAKIEQDAKTISIQSSSGKPYNQWKSLMMNFVDSEISYAYSVSYTGDTILQGKPTGFEKLSVRQRYPSDSKSGKPILLSGTFSHCAEGQPHVYRGTVVFCSSKHLASIEIKKDMSSLLKQGIQKIQNEFI